MGRVSEVIVGENDIATFKCSDAVTDNDINKPVTLDTSDTVTLAGAGDEIYGFIDSVDSHTEDGAAVVGVQKGGRKWVLMSGTYSMGSMVEGAANTAESVANAGDWGILTEHTLDDTTATTLMNSIFSKNWKVIYGAGTDASEALIELVA